MHPLNRSDGRLNSENSILLLSKCIHLSATLSTFANSGKRCTFHSPKSPPLLLLEIHLTRRLRAGAVPRNQTFFKNKFSRSSKYLTSEQLNYTGMFASKRRSRVVCTCVRVRAKLVKEMDRVVFFLFDLLDLFLFYLVSSVAVNP